MLIKSIIIVIGMVFFVINWWILNFGLLMILVLVLLFVILKLIFINNEIMSLSMFNMI